jgi:membrane-bound metal-dependent hydrolase YbcI (DUF457 family)
MPLPLGHTAIGLAAYQVCRDRKLDEGSLWMVAIFMAILANLPDIDVVLGLVLEGNGWAFHRGPTHSLFFALATGFLASRVWRVWSHIPKCGFVSCFLVIFSHVAADIVYGGPISVFWPFEVDWAPGYIGWGDVVGSVILQAYQDVGIVVVSGMVLVITGVLRQYRNRPGTRSTVTWHSWRLGDKTL